MSLASLLSSALDFILPPRDAARIVRACTPEALGSIIAPRVTESGAVALLPYRHRVVRSCIIEAKFGRNARAFSLLGGVLAEYLAALEEESMELAATGFVIVPVPLGPKRLRERGYNQIAEIARASGATTAALLERVRDTAPQTTLSRRERLINMESAFAVSAGIPLERTYIVLDDVTTTGATLAAAAAALRRAGAASVRTLALAH
jgi:ComF family protein